MMKFFNSKITAIVAFVLAAAALLAAILVPVLNKRETGFDTNEDDIGGITVDWEEGGTFGNALSGDMVMVGTYEFGSDSVTATSFGTAGTFNMVFYNAPGLMSDYSFKATMKLDTVDTNAKTDYKFGFYPVFHDEVNRAEVCFIRNQAGENLMSISLCLNGTWEKLWEVIPIPEDTDFFEENEIEAIKIGSTVKLYLNGEKVYEFEADIAEAQVGFLSESTMYSATGISVTQATAFPQETLPEPDLTLEGANVSWQDVPHASGYELKVGDGEPFAAQSPFNVRTYLVGQEAEDGEYPVCVRATGDDASYLDSAWSEPVTYRYYSQMQELPAPVVSLDGSMLRFDPVENGGGYLIQLYVESNGKDVLAVVEETKEADFDLAEMLAAYCKADETYRVGVVALGDDVNYSDSPESNRVELPKGSDWNSVKGAFTAGEHSVKLVAQETTDGDNFPNYDLINRSGAYTDFRISADVCIFDQETTVSAKAGIRIAVDDSKYFTAFVTSGSISLLCTLDGGASWVQIWNSVYTIPDYDAEAGVRLSLEREGETIRVYVGNVLVHTETGFAIGADTPVKIGLTSEAVSPVAYENILIGEVSSAGTYTAVKGTFDTQTEGKVRLTAQETTDGDNFATGYDLIYRDGTYTDFSITATVSLLDEDMNTFSKAGIKLAVDESKYFTVFVTSDGSISLLSTLDGSMSWLQLWTNVYIVPEFDAAEGVTLTVVRLGGTIAVYIDGGLVHTETGFTVGADTSVMVGFTSEAVSPVTYGGISLTEALTA